MIHWLGENSSILIYHHKIEHTSLLLSIASSSSIENNLFTNIRGKLTFSAMSPIEQSAITFEKRY